MFDKLGNPEFDIYPVIARGMTAKQHWCSDGIAVKELASVLVGMANTDGGRVYIGVNPDTGKVEGVGDVAAGIDMIFQACLLAEPTLVLPVPKSHQVAKAKILEVSVPQGLPHVYNLEGRYYGREGRQTSTIGPSRLRKLFLERGLLQFESQVPDDASLADLDPQQLAAYYQSYSTALNLPDDHQLPALEDLLQQRGCLKDVDGKLKPTYAALLVFGRNPQRWLPTAQILATRFSGTSFGDRFIKLEINGSLVQQLKEAEKFLKTNLQTVVRMVGLTHQEALEYPYNAVRELVINSVAHRDYNSQGDCIHINIFSNQLEVTSPGGLPGPITIENILQARFSRNPIIIQLLADLGYVERLGYGLDRVVKSMSENYLPPPSFEEATGVFRVTLRNEQLEDLSHFATQDLNPRQVSALNYLVARKRITNRAYQDLCPDVSPETIRRDLSDLVSRGILVKIGDKKSTYYILK
jgi:ATP-dependent DNA helicase RecG